MYEGCGKTKDGVAGLILANLSEAHEFTESVIGRAPWFWVAIEVCALKGGNELFKPGLASNRVTEDGTHAVVF